MTQGWHPLAPEGTRWGRMGLRVRRSLEEAGLPVAARDAILGVHEAAGVHRAAALGDNEEDPRWLHPGRNLLILLDDVGERDPAVLQWGAGLDQLAPALTLPATATALLAADFPFLPGGLAAPAPMEVEEAWLEGAVLLPEAQLRLLLADALDHLRHLHLHPDPEFRTRLASRAQTALLPLAERLGGPLERRLRWWCTRVAPGLAVPGQIGSN